MNNSIVTKVICGGLLACLVLSVSYGQGGATSPLLVVDLQQAVELSDEYANFAKGAEKKMRDKQTELKKLVLALNEKHGELMRLAPSDRDERWYSEISKSLHEQAALKAKETLVIGRIKDDITRKLNTLMVDAQSNARKIMDARGAALVMISKMGPISLNSDQELKDELISRRVIAAQKGVDITEEVIERMNSAYKARN